MTKGGDAALLPPKRSARLEWRELLAAAGKLLVASLFWWSAFFDIIPTWPDVVSYVAGQHVPAPATAAVLATTLEIVGPLALLMRRSERYAALALVGYCLATAVLFHDFWHLTGDERAAQLVHFCKNLALAGALAMFAART